MSLILEALKKVERERTAPDQRGFLVLGPAAWAPARSNAGWIAGIVAAAAIAGGVVYALTRPDSGASRTQAAAGNDRPETPPTAPTAEQAVPPATAMGRSAAEWGPPPRSTTSRTPARPSAAAPAQVVEGPALSLQAISRQDGVPIAVINERVVREGDTFDGVRVLRIGAADVEVEVGGARRILRF